MQSLRGKSAAESAGLEGLILAARDTAPVSGLTHNFYRYPARFSPNFVRAAVLAFSEEGDWVLDPFAGGGTSLVEAIAHGRNAIGIDISQLATFVCEAKTLRLSDADVKQALRWLAELPGTINIHQPSEHSAEYAAAGYHKHLDNKKYWRLRKAIEQVLTSIQKLRGKRVQTLARCALLRTAQWALDGRKRQPTIAQFREELAANAAAMVNSAIEFRARVDGTNGAKAVCLNRAIAGIEDDPRVTRLGSPKLIVTSPPYPGIHMLYHRWQVDGRKETAVPFWIANRLDGAGSSYYTMGDRHYPELRTYFDNLEVAYRSVARLCSEETTVVQMVAFSEPEWQLPRYLDVMQRCGLEEYLPWERGADLSEDGRLWREVPNRKWHAYQKDHSPGAREVVLIHRKT